ncbi:hypothetical protein [Clostridium akagii]|nr:hypothetical protein [Clostridium akagii]
MKSDYGENISKKQIDNYYATYDYSVSEELDKNVLDEIVAFFNEALKSNN